MLNQLPIAGNMEGALEILARLGWCARVRPCWGNGEYYDIHNEEEAAEKLEEAFAHAPLLDGIPGIVFGPLNEDFSS